MFRRQAVAPNKALKPALPTSPFILALTSRCHVGRRFVHVAFAFQKVRRTIRHMIVAPTMAQARRTKRR